MDGVKVTTVVEYPDGTVVTATFEDASITIKRSCSFVDGEVVGDVDGEAMVFGKLLPLVVGVR